MSKKPRRFEMRLTEDDDFLDDVDEMRETDNMTRPQLVRLAVKELKKKWANDYQALTEAIDQGLALSSGELTEPEDEGDAEMKSA